MKVGELERITEEIAKEIKEKDLIGKCERVALLGKLVKEKKEIVAFMFIGNTIQKIWR